jgi:hypothetical protein
MKVKEMVENLSNLSIDDLKYLEDAIKENRKGRRAEIAKKTAEDKENRKKTARETVREGSEIEFLFGKNTIIRGFVKSVNKTTFTVTSDEFKGKDFRYIKADRIVGVIAQAKAEGEEEEGVEVAA